MRERYLERLCEWSLIPSALHLILVCSACYHGGTSAAKKFRKRDGKIRCVSVERRVR